MSCLLREIVLKSSGQHFVLVGLWKWRFGIEPTMEEHFCFWVLFLVQLQASMNQLKSTGFLGKT